MARRTDGNGPAATDGAEQPWPVALAVLVVIAAVALRGYVPGAEEPARDRTTENPAATGSVSDCSSPRSDRRGCGHCPAAEPKCPCHRDFRPAGLVPR